mgnify:CR=1 FL=1
MLVLPISRQEVSVIRARLDSKRRVQKRVLFFLNKKMHFPTKIVDTILHVVYTIDVREILLLSGRLASVPK